MRPQRKHFQDYIKQGSAVLKILENTPAGSSLHLSYDDITSLKTVLSIQAYFDAQKLAAASGQKQAVAIIDGVTIFQQKEEEK